VGRMSHKIHLCRKTKKPKLIAIPRKYVWLGYSEKKGRQKGLKGIKERNK
jgi:hypothetical protein